MITIIDYGLGNVQAFVNVYKRLHIPVAVASTPAALASATRLILPGVGAFDHAMQRFEASGMRSVVEDLVVARKVPVLGICVGMQMLAEGSDEGSLPGLGWVPGRVRAFSAMADLAGMALPHMGWNDVSPVGSSQLFQGLQDDARFYFLHSFFFEAFEEEHVLAEAVYGIRFACAVSAGNVSGVQFHPEKSHRFGVALLKNFAED